MGGGGRNEMTEMWLLEVKAVTLQSLRILSCYGPYDHVQISFLGKTSQDLSGGSVMIVIKHFNILLIQ